MRLPSVVAVHDDEQALLQTSQQARRELEQLFGADRGEGVLGGLVRREKADDGGQATAGEPRSP